MAILLTITKPDELGTVHDLIHDCFFDLADIQLTTSVELLSFRFRKLVATGWHGWKNFVSTAHTFPAIECFLNVFHVQSYSIEDTERVETYDFNVLKFDTASKCITVETGVPIDIRISVREFKLSVEITDKIFSGPAQWAGRSRIY